MYAFKRLSEVREITDNWIREYNEERPHDSLGDLTPREYLMANLKQENSKVRGPNLGALHLNLSQAFRLNNLCFSKLYIDLLWTKFFSTHNALLPNKFFINLTLELLLGVKHNLS
jgi:hypothetical protein